MKKRFKMTMSVNDENSAGAANNNNCSKVDLDHYETQTDLGRSLWPPVLHRHRRDRNPVQPGLEDQRDRKAEDPPIHL